MKANASSYLVDTFILTISKRKKAKNNKIKT